MATYIEVTPAYGRDYTSQKAVKEAWAAGADLKIVTFGPHMGRYVNNADAADLKVLVRYAKLQRMVSVK
jgi:hypothetical protein